MSTPTDYYSVLRRAVSGLDANTEEARRTLYQRARQAILDAHLPPSQVAAERSALEAAIERIEAETPRGGARVPPLPPMRSRPPPRARPEGDPPDLSTPRPRLLGMSPALIAALATAAVLLLAIIGYVVWLRGTPHDASTPAVRADVPVERAPTQRITDGAREAGRSFIFNRQMVYYRTIHPVGTIVIAKSQKYLYLVRPNVAAMRYTIGIGRGCQNVVGLLLVSAKEEWQETPPPQTQQASARVERVNTRSRFGVRSLALGETGHRIHGTYAATTDGDDGCFVLVNDDITDLYNRVETGARAVIN
jgi:lipoprotein-anchoring transpeptidase ErfK/SrfK